MTDQMAPEMERTLRALDPKALEDAIDEYLVWCEGSYRHAVREAIRTYLAALPSREASVLAELELMASEDDTEEAAQADRRWHQWAMRQAGICHGGNGSLTVASAIREARRIVDQRRAP